MNLRDIVNREVTTIANCESEPIHIPGSIQPHGVLIAITPSSVIEFCSQNCNEVFNQAPAQILQQPLSAVWPQLWQKIEAFIQTDLSGIKPVIESLHDNQWEIFISKSNDHYIIEIEKLQPLGDSADDLFNQTTRFVSFIEQSRNLQDLCQRIADETRNITGYDRVMIYRFDKEYNGEVFAESKRKDLEPFLELHYPHTDIPVQARELYLRNLMRIIADVNYTPVPLLTADDGQNKQLDLSDSVLRSVSPIHIQYLKNMGVGATLTLSLLLDGKLWGLIACHHMSPLHLSFSQRRKALLQGHFLTSQIKVRQVAEEHEVNVVVEAHLQQLLGIIPQDNDFDLKFEKFTSLLSVANATGVVILHKGVLYDKGLVPPREKVMALIYWLAENSLSHQFATSHLKIRYPKAEDISRCASGILYYALGNPRKDCVIWFREELDKTVNWAGNPHDAIQKNKVNNMLMPRTSFALWAEKVRFTSKEWRISEINAAARFASILQNQFYVEHLRHEEAHQRLLNEKLQKANDELANINWITTHDLKEPLRKILLFSSRVMEEDTENISQVIINSIQKIQASASRMQMLVDDITSYSTVSDKESAYQPVDLNEVVKNVMEEYADEIKEHKITMLAEKMPTVNGIKYQMQQLFTNLIGNSIKFAKEGTPLQIEISCSEALGITGNATLNPAKSYYLIKLQDNGIGFNPEKGNKIFEIFYRLHDRQSYPGTGIGLAICKKIVENHGGIITASGQPNQGATFRIYLPKQ